MKSPRLRRAEKKVLGNLITGFVIILVGVTLAPTVANQVAGAATNTNFSATSITILQLTPLFFNLAIAVAAIDIAVVGLRQSGLIM